MQDTLNDKIRVYAGLKTHKAEIDELAKQAKERLDAAEADVISAMFDAAEASGLEDPGALRVAVDGYNYSVAIKQFWGISAADKDEGYDALRAVGLGDLITERVDDRTLTKTLASIAAENGGELPGEFQEIPMREYSKQTLSARKIGG